MMSTVCLKAKQPKGPPLNPMHRYHVKGQSVSGGRLDTLSQQQDKLNGLLSWGLHAADAAARNSGVEFALLSRERTNWIHHSRGMVHASCYVRSCRPSPSTTPHLSCLLTTSAVPHA